MPLRDHGIGRELRGRARPNDLPLLDDRVPGEENVDVAKLLAARGPKDWRDAVKG